MPSPLLQLLVLFLASSATVSANPFPAKLQGLSFQQLFGRGTCAGVTCGWDGQLCCGTGEACYTDASNQAQCSSTAAGVAVVTTQGSGYWNVYTTTYVESELTTVTSVISSWCGSSTAAYVAATTTAAATASCDYANNESPCGSICCASGQYCVVSGQCAAAAVSGSSAYYSTSAATTGFSAPLRPTSSTLVVLTSTASPTTTEPFVAPVATGANITLTPTEAEASHGLSGGAIAGIVIGVLLGIALLIALCVCFCLKGLLDGVLAIFGLGGKKKRTRETEYIEEYHHHTSRNGRGDSRSWYGSGPRRVERRTEKKKSGGFGNALGIGAGLAGLAAVLGIKRNRDDKKRRRDEEKYTDYSSSYGSYYTSESSASSDDRRTRDTRRSSRR